MRTSINISYTEAMSLPVTVRDEILDRLVEDWKQDAKLFKKVFRILSGARK
jgi:hypothetical protein